MSLPVFRKGEWISYPLPAQLDPLWSTSHQFKAASVYATALSKGFSSEESAILAECLVNQEVYPDLRYSWKLQRKISQLFKDHEETA